MQVELDLNEAKRGERVAPTVSNHRDRAVAEEEKVRMVLKMMVEGKRSDLWKLHHERMKGRQWR